MHEIDGRLVTQYDGLVVKSQSVPVSQPMKRSCRWHFCNDVSDIFSNTVTAASGPSRNLAKCIAELVRPAAVAAYQEQLASVFTSNAEARRKAKDAAVKALDEAFNLLQLYAHGCDLLQVRCVVLCGIVTGWTDWLDWLD